MNHRAFGKLSLASPRKNLAFLHPLPDRNGRSRNLPAADVLYELEVREFGVSCVICMQPLSRLSKGDCRCSITVTTDMICLLVLLLLLRLLLL